MAANGLEAAHRRELRTIAATTGRRYVYYRDVDIEETIRPTVELLNSPWTVTLNSCGGHFEPGTPRFQYPYVHFAVLRGRKTAWQKIFKHLRKAIAPLLTRDATLFVQTSFVLPAARPSIFIWRFCPYPYLGHSRHFGSERQFRSVLARFMGKVCTSCAQCMSEPAPVQGGALRKADRSSKIEPTPRTMHAEAGRQGHSL